MSNSQQSSADHRDSAFSRDLARQRLQMRLGAEMMNAKAVGGGGFRISVRRGSCQYLPMTTSVNQDYAMPSGGRISIGQWNLPLSGDNTTMTVMTPSDTSVTLFSPTESSVTFLTSGVACDNVASPYLSASMGSSRRVQQDGSVLQVQRTNDGSRGVHLYDGGRTMTASYNGSMGGTLPNNGLAMGSLPYNGSEGGTLPSAVNSHLITLSSYNPRDNPSAIFTRPRYVHRRPSEDLSASRAQRLFAYVVQPTRTRQNVDQSSGHQVQHDSVVCTSSQQSQNSPVYLSQQNQNNPVYYPTASLANRQRIASSSLAGNSSGYTYVPVPNDTLDASYNRDVYVNKNVTADNGDNLSTRNQNVLAGSVSDSNRSRRAMSNALSPDAPDVISQLPPNVSIAWSSGRGGETVSLLNSNQSQRGGETITILNSGQPQRGSRSYQLPYQTNNSQQLQSDSSDKKQRNIGGMINDINTMENSVFDKVRMEKFNKVNNTYTNSDNLSHVSMTGIPKHRVEHYMSSSLSPSSLTMDLLGMNSANVSESPAGRCFKQRTSTNNQYMMSPVPDNQTSTNSNPMSSVSNNSIPLISNSSSMPAVNGNPMSPLLCEPLSPWSSDSDSQLSDMSSGCLSPVVISSTDQNSSRSSSANQNLFEKCRFELGTVGLFGRTESQADVPTYYAEDFDDLVQKLRNHNIPVVGGKEIPSSRPLKQLTRLNTIQDVGYALSDAKPADIVLSTSMDNLETSSVQKKSDATSQLFAREDLRKKIEAFNNGHHGIIITLDQNNNTFQGFLRVYMNLIRPVSMSLSSRPPSVYDALPPKRHSEPVNGSQLASFRLPKDTAKVIHINSSTTVQEVIRILLGKFHIVDNPHKFALYERLETPVEGRKPTVKMTRLATDEKPLLLCLQWSNNSVAEQRFVLQENDTGEIMWDVFSLPELENFHKLLNREEKEYIRLLKRKYQFLRVGIDHRLKEFEKQGKNKPS